MSSSAFELRGRHAAHNGILLLRVREAYGPLAYVKPTPHPLEPLEILYTVSTYRGSFSDTTERGALTRALDAAATATTTPETR
jgi:hypothetical protein